MEKRVALALLGLHEENPSAAHINDAYRAAIQLNHPDRFIANERLRIHAEEQCKLINEARTVLLNRNWDTAEAETDWQTRSQSKERESSQNWNSADASSKHYDRQGERSCSSEDGNAKRPYAPETDTQFSITPLLDIWETSVGLSVAGIMALLALMTVTTNVTGLPSMILGVVQIGYVLFQIIYAVVIYPSFFGLKPRIKSPRAISFWNCAVGFFIFGPLWNSCLTRRRKGKSHVVFSLLLILLVGLWVLTFGYMLAIIL